MRSLVQCSGGVVCCREHCETAVAADETEFRLLVAHQAEDVLGEVDGPAAQSLLPEEGVAEDHHHGPVGGGSQPDWRVAATLLQSGADEEPWVSALRLDEGVGEAATWPHVHWGHVDLNKVASDGEVIARGCSSRSGGERGGGTPRTGAAVVNCAEGRRKGGIGEADGWIAMSAPGTCGGAGGGRR